MLFDISKNSKGGCQAKRCKPEEGAELHELPGDAWGREIVTLCTSHTEKAVTFLEQNPGWKPEHRFMQVTQETAAIVVHQEPPSLMGLQPGPNLQALADADQQAALDEQAEIERIQTEAQEAKVLLEAIEGLTVDTQDDLKTVGEFLREVQKLSKQYKTDKESKTGPLSAQLATWQARYSPGERFLNRAAAILKGLIERAELSAAKNNPRQLTIAAAAVAQGDTSTATEAIQRVQHVSDLDGISTIAFWEPIIEDEEQIDRKWLMPNMPLLKKHGRDAGDEPPEPIAGVKYIRRSQVNARAAED